tara:strand:+ start:188 stop:925 length:738 start_codon:yes stop_codon:yes gene_type:complete
MSIEPKLLIHIPKNGGSSLYHNDPDDIWNNVVQDKITTTTIDKHIWLPETTDNWGTPTHYFEFDEPDMKYWNMIGNWDHARIRDIKPECIHSPFAIVRNPWDRTISRYFYSRKNENEEAMGSFEEWLESRHKFANIPYLWLRASRGWYSQLEYITNEEGKVICDILRYEHYDDDLKLYLDLPKNYYVPEINVGTYDGIYREIYTPKTIQIVAAWYKDDIDYFGFDFGTAATRNYWNDEEYKNNNI